MITNRSKNTLWGVLGIAALLSVMAGCVKEDMDDCPPPGPKVKIDFTLFDPESLFTDEISSVVAVLFDGKGTYIPPATTLDKASLERYPGVEMALDPGDYRMVFWANVGTNTEIRVVDGVPVISYKNLDGTVEQVLGNGDAVWYAPAVSATRVDVNAKPLEHYEFTVPVDGNFTDKVAFTQTHNSVNVYIGGLPLEEDSMPRVGITGLACAADFYGMTPLDEPLPCVTSAITTVRVQKDDETYALGALETSPLGDMAGMYLVIKNAAGEEMYRVPLSDAIAQSGADPTAHEINLLIIFGDLGVTIEIWDWDGNNIGKDF